MAAAAVMVSASLPAFLVGALAPHIGTEMPFAAAEVGITMACTFTVAGVLSPLGGRLVQQLGAHRVARIISALCTAGLLGISVAHAVWQLVGALLLVGLANALSQPASNQLLAQLQTPRRRALAFGVVQAAIPAAALAAGAALAVASHGVDWRATTLVAAVCTIAVQAVVPRRPASLAPVPPARTPGRTPMARPSRPVPAGQLATLVLTGALASAAATALPTFIATAGLAQGLSPFTVAGAQMAGSIGSIVVRVLAPVAVSQASEQRRFTLMAVLIGAGTAGLLLLVPGTPAAFVLGAVLGLAFGWGWNSLYNQLVAATAPGRVASTTGSTQAGVFLGGTAGPALFALVAARIGFPTAWTVMAVLMAVAAACALAGRAGRRRPTASQMTTAERI
ncbi:MFS transporter [Micromonospora sp. NPDC049282]|uniref:MFS transporter n=1 Tax=Micromonospora sp. NPDC049282 TaxID=3364269 RepID=UPI00371EFACA